MQGAAKSNDFMLGSATLMLGPQADLFNLGFDQSVGLVKNVAMKTTPGFVELTQGVHNSLVYSVMNSNAVGISAEMFEYTMKNIAYSLSLDGSQFAAETANTTVKTALAAPIAPALTAAAVEVNDAAQFAVGKYAMIHVGSADNVMIRKIVAVDEATDTITFDSGFKTAIGVDTVIKQSAVVAVGSSETAPFLSCKLVGTLADGSIVPMLFPKVRISSGLSMAFKTDNFDHIPFELKIFDLVESDPHYDKFSVIGPGNTPAKGMILD